MVRNKAAFGSAQRRRRAERDFRFDRHLARFFQRNIAVTWRFAADGEFQRVRVAVGNIGSTLYDAITPGREINPVDLAEMDVDPALADPAATDAWEVSLAAHFERIAAVHDVIPTIPLRHAGRVHGADEIAQPLRRGHADFLSADPIHLRNDQIR